MTGGSVADLRRKHQGSALLEDRHRLALTAPLGPSRSRSDADYWSSRSQNTRAGLPPAALCSHRFGSTPRHPGGRDDARYRGVTGVQKQSTGREHDAIVAQDTDLVDTPQPALRRSGGGQEARPPAARDMRRR